MFSAPAAAPMSLADFIGEVLSPPIQARMLPSSPHDAPAPTECRGEAARTREESEGWELLSDDVIILQ